MPAIFYGAQAYRRDNGNLPELRLVNMFHERAPAEEQGAVLLSRKGLASHLTVGAGPVTGVFSKPGVFDGDIFSVSGGFLYRGTTLIGAIAGAGPAAFAGRAGELLITAGAGLYSYNGTDLVAVTFPDGASVTDIEFHDGLFIAARAGSHKYYWSAVLDGRSWDALDFASAESAPDVLFGVKVLNDTLWLFGEATIEPWANTGGADAPYQRIEQRIFSKGVIAPGTVVEMDNSLLFPGSDGMVYRIAEVPQRISDHGIEERIEQSATVLAFGFIFEGHSFYCLRLATGTFAYDVATGQWCEFASYGRANFRGRCAAMDGQTVVLGDDEEGTLWTFDGWEDGGEHLERLFTAAFPLSGGTVAVDNLNIEANVGWTESLEGQAAEPTAEMRSSRDAGAKWGNWRAARLGRQGEYRTRTRWRACGIFDHPGAMFEIRCTDPLGFRVSKVTVNEAGGGRSR